MAYDYNKVKEQYERMDSQQKQQFADMMKWNGNYADFMSRYNAEKTPTSSTTPTKTTTTSTTTSTSTPTYSSYTPVKNGWPADWYASATERNMATGGAEFWGLKSKASTTTPTTTTTRNDNVAKWVRDAWDKKSYQEQQDLLNKNPWLKEQIEKAWWTFKTSEAAPTTTDTWATTWAETPNWWWDYQDNSPERMAEIAKNLEWYKQTMPYLFNDKKAFDDFFINWVNRSQEQIDFLNDWFYKNQKYSKYDALTPDSIWYWIAYWDIPEDYLTMLKTTDPAKYQAALQAKQDAEDKIKDKTALDTTSFLSWDSEDTITSKAIEWLKTQWLFLDKDGNLIDDRTENYATDEEKQYAKDAADIIARNLDIDNTVKHTYDDLVKAYPWATKATLMAMAQDRNSDLLREKENNNVELTRLQWYMDYMQSERQERNRIWENAINQLQKQYGMYYQYTPEWMSELAQAQYAATNITLDQADKWTDTQKQMALQRVLDDYYAKYWDIIQRSEAQVINDVMALAEQKGISLSQALEENFLKYLRQKPWFEELSTLATKNPEIVKIWDNAYAYWDDNWNLVSVWWTLWANWVYQFSDAELRTVGSDGKFTDTVWNDINSIWHILNSEDWLRIGTYTNPKWYTYNVYATREDWIQATENLLKRAYYWMTLWDAAQKWIWQGKDISDAKKVIQSKWLWLNDKLSDANVRKFIEAIWTREWTLKWKSLDEWAKWWKTLWTPKWTEWWQKRNPELETFLDKWKDAEWDRLKEKDFWAVYWKELEAKWVSKEDFLKQFKEYYTYQSRDAYLEILSNLDHLIELTWKEFDLWERASALSWLWDAGKVFKYIKNNLTVNWLQEARDRWLKLWVLSDSDVKMIAEASSVLDWDVSQWTWNRALQDFRQSLLNNNPYLKEQYKYQSAYSPNKWFKYNDNDRSFTFWTRKDQSWTQWITQWTTTQAKSIKNLWK